MMQFKLFELLDDIHTYEELLMLFDEGVIYKFTDRIIGIAYDYGINSYVDILKKVKKSNLRQLIITSSLFLDLISHSVKENYFLNDIKFIYPILKENIDEVNDYIELINSSSGLQKENNRVGLFRELDWITSDECIDIKCVSIDIQSKSGIYYKIELFNNGVLLIDDDTIIEETTKLIKEIF